jgi:hypothetical protein
LKKKENTQKESGERRAKIKEGKIRKKRKCGKKEIAVLLFVSAIDKFAASPLCFSSSRMAGCHVILHLHR